MRGVENTAEGTLKDQVREEAGKEAEAEAHPDAGHVKALFLMLCFVTTFFPQKAISKLRRRIAATGRGHPCRSKRQPSRLYNLLHRFGHALPEGRPSSGDRRRAHRKRFRMK